MALVVQDDFVCVKPMQEEHATNRFGMACFLRETNSCNYG